MVLRWPLADDRAILEHCLGRFPPESALYVRIGALRDARPPTADVSPELAPCQRAASDLLISSCVSLGSPIEMLPIIPHSQVNADDRTRRRVSEYADRLKSQPQFREDAALSAFAVTGMQEAPSLVLDDFSEVALFPRSSLYMEQRARLRAVSGDIVVTATPVHSAFDSYYAHDLGLGEVQWLQAPSACASLKLAQACWRDRDVRREIVHAVRARGLRYVHPYLGNRDVWRMAQLLSGTAHRPLQVIAPPPALAHWVNDKVAFAQLVSELLGSQFIPQTKSAYGFALLSQRIQELAQTSRYLGLKVPHASGGSGNFFLDAKPLRSMCLRELNDHIRSVIPAGSWPADEPLLVDVWETNVIETASIQTWIPPLAEGDPRFEGIFSQMISDNCGTFVGCVPLVLPEHIEREVLAATSTLILLFQRMGYVGRCSFDFLLVGKKLENARLEFIECNGRWGGTSIPMTLVNRLINDTRRQPFAVIATDHAIPARMSFSEVTTALGDDLFRRSAAGESTGWLIPFNPGRLAKRGLNWIVFGKDMQQVEHRILQDLPARLQSLEFSQLTAKRDVCADSHTIRPGRETP